MTESYSCITESYDKFLVYKSFNLVNLIIFLRVKKIQAKSAYMSETFKTKMSKFQFGNQKI